MCCENTIFSAIFSLFVDIKHKQPILDVLGSFEFVISRNHSKKRTNFSAGNQLVAVNKTAK